jgi:hypothetical protein
MLVVECCFVSCGDVDRALAALVLLGNSTNDDDGCSCVAAAAAVVVCPFFFRGISTFFLLLVRCASFCCATAVLWPVSAVVSSVRSSFSFSFVVVSSFVVAAAVAVISSRSLRLARAAADVRSYQPVSWHLRNTALFASSAAASARSNNRMGGNASPCRSAQHRATWLRSSENGVAPPALSIALAIISSVSLSGAIVAVVCSVLSSVVHADSGSAAIALKNCGAGSINIGDRLFTATTFGLIVGPSLFFCFFPILHSKPISPFVV